MVTKITIMNMKTKFFFFLALVLTFLGTQKLNAQNTFVDLGLPSGTLWATCNVGADSPGGLGTYFAWGETSGKTSYTWSNYKHSNGTNSSLTKYCTDETYGDNGFTDGLTELQPEDDAATANWGADWQIPSDAQFKELLDDNYTTKERTTQNGYKGVMITSKSNGHSIFLPALGCKSDNTAKYVGEHGYYWSRLLDTPTTKALNLLLYLLVDECDFRYKVYDRFFGFCVRPVRVQEAHTISDIPNGWKVNGSTTSGTYQAKGGDVLHFTPKNIPAGKRIKSIKVVKK